MSRPFQLGPATLSQPGATPSGAPPGGSHKRGRDNSTLRALPGAKAPAPPKSAADWMRAGGNGSTASRPKAGGSVSSAVVDSNVSSIRSKLSAPKALKAAPAASETLPKERAEAKVPTGLTREKLLEVQEQHRQRLQALGKPVPQCTRRPLPLCGNRVRRRTSSHLCPFSPLRAHRSE